MRMMFFFVFVAFLSCKSDTKKDKFIEKFTNVETERLRSTPVELIQSDVSFSSMFKMVYSDSLLFISEIKDPEYDMKIVDLRRGEVNNFARRGRAGDEIQFRGCNFSIDSKNSKLYVHDGPNHLIYSLDSLKGGIYNPVSRFNMELDSDPFYESIYCNEGYIVGGIHEKRFGLYNIESHSYKKSYEFEDDLPIGSLNNQALYVNHPNKPMAAYFYYKSAITGILKIEEGEIHKSEDVIWTTDNREIITKESRKIDHEKDQRNAFVSVAANEKYIYALYSGKTLNAKSVEELTKAYLSSSIYVFDWDGRAIKKFELDQEVRSIAIDESNDVLYAASYEASVPHLVKFHIND